MPVVRMRRRSILDQGISTIEPVFIPGWFDAQGPKQRYRTGVRQLQYGVSSRMMSRHEELIMPFDIHAMKIATLQTLRNTLGDSFVMSLYRERSLRRYQRSGVVFVHIPKAAGTSVCSALYGRRVGHFTLMELSESPNYDRIRALPSFTISRDPASRLYSSYRYARHGGGSAGSIAPDPAYGSDAFRSFGAFLEEWLVRQELESLDRVFWPQTCFLRAPEARLDYIGKVETMEATQAWLQSHCGLTLTIAHRNRSRACEAKTSEVGPSEKGLIRELYATDYERFDYL